MSLKERVKWGRESDARTLAEANIIQSNPERLKWAKKAAQILAKEAIEQANSTAKVVKKSSSGRLLSSSEISKSGITIKKG